MHVSLETLQLHIDYTIWASQRMLDAVTELTPEELTHDFGTADKSVLGTLFHIYGGDYAWIERMYGKSINKRPYDEHDPITTLQTEWPRVWERWRAYVCALTEETAEAEVSYSTFKGAPYRTPAWQIILHVVNHATHHRGQAAGFLRAFGKTPPVLDLMQYYREKANP